MIIKKLKWAILIYLLNCFLFSAAFGCKYTVQEIGFSDIGAQPYRLYVYAQNDTPTELVSLFEKLSYAIFLDANVDVEIINVNKQQNHPAIPYLSSQKINSFPAAILVSLENRCIVLPFSTKELSDKQAVWRVLENVVSSPIREKILKHIIESYGVVLLIEGKDLSKNKMAKKEAAQAIKRISGVIQLMPKPMNESVQLFTITRKAISEEKIFLWSIGLEKYDNDEPIVTVFYGRGRRMGPLITGEQITAETIFNLLTIIGADCECVLDRYWLLGTMIPLRWETTKQAELAKQLGFDVENPMVKSEMSQIISLPTAQNEKAINPLETGLLQYSEQAIKIKDNSSAPRLSFSQIQEVSSSDSISVLKIALFVIAGLVVIVLTAVGFILLKVHQRKKVG